MKTRKANLPALVAEGPVVKENALGGGLEGAERNSREMMTWVPPINSPDSQINRGKDLADARGRDAAQNDGYITGVVNTYRDSIVGSRYLLNCIPNYEALGASEEWAEQFQMVTEARFNLIAESIECWFDAAGGMTFTDIIRMGVSVFCYTGEVVATAEWLKDAERPFKTAIQMIAPTRLCNPNMSVDTEFLRKGVVRDRFGKAKSYWFRNGYPNDFMMGVMPQWVQVPARTTWGRRQVIHIKEAMQPDQTRGISDMVAVLKQIRMTSKFQDITLQNAVVNATYAAAVESELPSDAIFASMGAGGPGLAAMLGQYMTALNEYTGGANNIAIDGVKMPHLFPGTKLKVQPAGTPGGVGTGFEESLLRHIAAGLGLSYEQFSRDYTKTNYSSARASLAETFKYMQAKKTAVADRFANMIYALWMEEEIQRKDSVIPLPPNFNFYDPYMREALLKCEWIGAAKGQIDEVKETQAAIMRINAGLSTRQKEISLLGDDYRTVFRQAAREQKLAKSLGLDFSAEATKPGANDRQSTMKNGKEEE